MTLYPVADNIDAWIAELESGKHKRTTGALMVRNGAMCCLGVAADKVLHVSRRFSSYDNLYKFDDLDDTLAAYERLGLRDKNGASRRWLEPQTNVFVGKSRKPHRAMHESLVVLNDAEDGYPFMGERHRMNFAYIAARLRVDLLTDHYGYFTEAARAEWCAKHNLIP